AARHEPGVEPLFYGDPQLRDRMIQLHHVGRMIVVQKLLGYAVEDSAKLGSDFAERELEIPPVHVALRRGATDECDIAAQPSQRADQPVRNGLAGQADCPLAIRL